MRDNDATGAVAELAASQHGVFSKSQAAQLGFTAPMIRTRIARGQWEEPWPRVLRVAGSAETWLQRLIAPTLKRGVAASHRAASALSRLDGFPRDVLEVSGPRGTRLIGIEAEVHEVGSLPRSDLIVVEGIVTTGLARTLADLGAVVSRDEVEKALDDFQRRGYSLRWAQETAARLHRPGQEGTGVLLELLGERAPGYRVRGSWFERVVERLLAISRLPPLVRQHEVFDDQGRIGQVDLAMPDIRLGIEAHSRQFHFGPRAERADERRDNRFSRVGWDLVYLGYYDPTRPEIMVKVVVDVAERRIADLGQSS
jgi:very-short-patch-repair endonuclease